MKWDGAPLVKDQEEGNWTESEDGPVLRQESGKSDLGIEPVYWQPSTGGAGLRNATLERPGHWSTPAVSPVGWDVATEEVKPTSEEAGSPAADGGSPVQAVPKRSNPLAAGGKQEGLHRMQFLEACTFALTH